ncbi:nucleotidyl transferase AbiEii/AbiGii toxin family protein [Dyadobacter sp. CY347]|uniref:nucleotidyl transferase AbiEii/AbiGii toxin family protein n=1 Tax=Dyadobacter sp. CY347 TaxID=2909336 RepID=UPI001F263DDA|nr:nucleotidyl transferase AbiEii/AbiGii toxin family protein [Dyadobacter sp. CY347]MCF2489905.1 nucleotidyl transferase AbiEii/AbiGii toxin family protein [Dyadobacter sp. CY347]
MIDLLSLRSWLQLSDATKLNIYTETGRKIGLPAMAIEKDWWVVHTLAMIFSMECAPALIFKGGTSLSKGWNLIQRFSEDIDLAIDREYLGFPGDLNRQQIKKLRKASYAFMTTTFIKELTERFAAAGFQDVNIRYSDTGQSDQDPMIIEVYYPKLTEKEIYLKPGVLVEVGCRSLREPTTQRTFSTLVAENFSDRPFADSPITIPIVNPERTFLEKIFLLHEEFQKTPEKIRVDRLSRHLYDIEKLGQTEFAAIALSDADLYRTIVDHRKMFTALAEVDYNNHSPDKIVFVPPHDLLAAWEADYKQMRENMIFGEVSSFKVLIETLTVL